ncbi:hypothetical protein HXX76_010646 [Chlamydomonas incerta]|uniref:Uncharacterized protein n=1 Tax=Chlamydomonas incerta TaxID=51695 RepID=A0A835VYN0_CHLIN|nr:hypothetical protein HXX76_010646 [Chlamydomonas incerta]|eukprot:KAG2429866.1 hypothetical protein HXX76_010646 [Chlamydomonas incerta]
MTPEEMKAREIPTLLIDAMKNQKRVSLSLQNLMAVYAYYLWRIRVNWEKLKTFGAKGGANGGGFTDNSTGLTFDLNLYYRAWCLSVLKQVLAKSTVEPGAPLVPPGAAQEVVLAWVQKKIQNTMQSWQRVQLPKMTVAELDTIERDEAALAGKSTDYINTWKLLVMAKSDISSGIIPTRGKYASIGSGRSGGGSDNNGGAAVAAANSGEGAAIPGAVGGSAGTTEAGGTGAGGGGRGGTGAGGGGRGGTGAGGGGRGGTGAGGGGRGGTGAGGGGRAATAPKAVLPQKRGSSKSAAGATNGPAAAKKKKKKGSNIRYGAG